MDREPSWIVTLMLKACVWLALVPFYISHAKSGPDRPVGSISIDCGSDIAYKDDAGIYYHKDEGFVETGENHAVSRTEDLNYRDFGRQLNTLRSFPEGDRNCYVLKAEQGQNSKYLIRAFFAYGNYDEKSQSQSFELHLGVNLWVQVNQTANDDFDYWEIIHTPLSDTIDVCLVKTGQTIPFISSLELRPLSSSIYHNLINPSNGPEPLLSLAFRVDSGSFSLPEPYQNKLFRYADDVYDRIWWYDSYFNDDDWNRLEEAVDDINPVTDADNYKLSALVFSTAAQSPNVSSPLAYDPSYEDTYLDKPYDYQVYFHFAEIQKLPNGGKRIINITLNSQNVLSEPLVLEYLKPVTLVFRTQGNVNFIISVTSQSDAPPILNAYEIYKLITQLDSPTHTQDVGAILDIKSSYRISRLNWQGDPCLPKQNKWEGLICNSQTIPRITSLNLSSSKLMGEISTSFSHLTELESLDLSHNELEGAIPEFLAELPNLEVLNLTGNKLSGPIPKALKEKTTTSLQLSVADNPDLCMKDSCKNKNNVIPVVASLSSLIAILLISLGFWLFRRHKVVRSYFKRGDSLRSKHRAFSYIEILDITDNFKTIIGEGGFGKVYFGILQDYTQVAVKLLLQSSMQGYKEFRSEVQLLMTVYHRNLVSLVGYCDEGEIKALIYEYMENGNLLQHLSESPNVLRWNERLNIAVDSAYGIDYLHNGCKPPLVHRDLKTSNILLDKNMHAKIADFGLCRAFENDIDSHVSTRPAGTLGYVDPEFQRAGNSNKKSDIYSFGIILFELITGKKVITRSHGENIHILQQVIPIVKRGDIQSVVDMRLEEEFSINSAWKAVEIAMSCISPTASERPDMSQILVELKECVALEMAQTIVERERTTFEVTSLHNEADIAPLAR